MLWLWCRCSSRVHAVHPGVHVCPFLRRGRCTSCRRVLLGHYPSLRARRADAPTPGPTSLSVAHAGSRAACSPPVRLGHLGRTVDVVSGVHVRPGQRCSEKPPGGTAPGDTPWLQTTSALRALKSQRAVLPPMARTGFGPLKIRVLPGPYRLAVLRQVTSPLFQKLPGSTSPGFQILKKNPHSLPGVLLLGGRSTGTSRQWTHLNCFSSQRHSTLQHRKRPSNVLPKPRVSIRAMRKMRKCRSEDERERKTRTPEEAETRWSTSPGARVEHFKRLKAEQPLTDPSRRISPRDLSEEEARKWKKQSTTVK